MAGVAQGRLRFFILILTPVLNLTLKSLTPKSPTLILLTRYIIHLVRGSIPGADNLDLVFHLFGVYIGTVSSSQYIVGDCYRRLRSCSTWPSCHLRRSLPKPHGTAQGFPTISECALEVVLVDHLKRFRSSSFKKVFMSTLASKLSCCLV